MIPWMSTGAKSSPADEYSQEVRAEAVALALTHRSYADADILKGLCTPWLKVKPCRASGPGGRR